MRVWRRIGCATLAWHEGYRAHIVHTGSMTPTSRSGDLVIDRPVQHSNHRGEVITFRHSDLSSDVSTHRITDVTGGVIHTKGDANPTPDVWDIRPNQVEGRVLTGVPNAGYVVEFLKRPAGVIALMAALVTASLLLALFFPFSSGLPTSGGSDSDPDEVSGLGR